MQTIAESSAEEWRAQAEFFLLADGGNSRMAGRSPPAFGPTGRSLEDAGRNEV
jgi:hypothetical protein